VPAPNFDIIFGEHIIFWNRIFIASHLRITIEIRNGESGARVFDRSGNQSNIMIVFLPESYRSFTVPSSALDRIVEEPLANVIVKYNSARFSARGQMSISGKTKLFFHHCPKKSIGKKQYCEQ
jgi:hypothetical protein